MQNMLTQIHFHVVDVHFPQSVRLREVCVAHCITTTIHTLWQTTHTISIACIKSHHHYHHVIL